MRVIVTVRHAETRRVEAEGPEGCEVLAHRAEKVAMTFAAVDRG